MKFKFEHFVCNLDIFKRDHDLLVRFYDSSKEQEEIDIVNLIIVEPGYGYICLKLKGDDSLLSGFLDEDIFSNPEMVEAAICFLESLSPLSSSAYIPYQIDLISRKSFIGYNGEY